MDQDILLKARKICKCFFGILMILFLSYCSGPTQNPTPKLKSASKKLNTGNSLLKRYPDSALKYAQQVYLLASDEKNPELELRALLLKAKSLLQLSKSKQALSSLKKVVVSVKNYPRIGAEGLYYSGVGEANLKNYLSAIINFRKVLNLSDKEGEPNIQGLAAEGLGDIYAGMSYNDNALKYYKLAQQFQKKAKNYDTFFALLNKIGDVYSAKKLYAKAKNSHTKALTYYIKHKKYKPQASTYFKVAEINFIKSNFEKAIENAGKAKDLAFEGSNFEVLGPDYLVLGKSFLALEQYEEAVENLNESQEVADILNDEALRSDVYQYLALAYEKLGDLNQSIEYFKAYNSSLKKLKEEHENQKSRQILTEIKLNKNQKEISSLQKKNEIIEKYSSLRSEGLVSNRGFIILLTAFVIAFILLVALYYKRFKDKKTMSTVLENKVIERTGELNQALRKLSFHMNNTSLAVVELSPHFNIVGWSGQAENVFGWQKKVVENKSFVKLDLFDDAYIKEVKGIFTKIRNGKLSRKFILTKNKHKSGQELFIEWNFSALYNESEEIISILCFANDVTNREKALAEAETANKELDNFIYKTSHDVKGPIARIEGIINLGLLEAQEEVSKNYFTMLRQVAGNFNIVLSRLFRIHGIYYHKPEAVNIKLKEEITYLLEKLQKKNALYDLKYTVDIAENLVWSTDKLLFYIIVQNIYENALDYRIDGLSEITILAEKTPYNMLKLKIRDNGTCIPLEAADRVFDMFFQNTAQSNTAGLGLYMVKKSVEKLEGSIKVLEDKKETIFEILLPATNTLAKLEPQLQHQ